MLTDDQAERAVRILRGMAARSHCAREDREDVAQDALLRLVECGPVLDAGLKFMCSWAINAPAQKSYQMLRRSSARAAKVETERLRFFGRLLFDGVRSEEALDAAVDIRHVVRMAALDEGEQRIVSYALRGMTHSAIAARIGVSRSTVTRRLHRICGRISDSVWFE